MTKYAKKSLEELGRIDKKTALESSKAEITLVLDEVRSMLNVGAIFRSSDAFGVKQIILLGITSRPPHREIHKSSLGAEDSVHWAYAEDWEAARKLLPSDHKLIALEQTHHSQPLHEYIPSSAHHVIVVGNEVHGVSDTILEEVDMSLEIEQVGHKHSLNVATSVGILLYHLTQVQSVG